MRELRLKYFIDMVSNIGNKSMSEAKVLEEAQRRMREAVTGTTDRFRRLERAMIDAGGNTSIQRQIGYVQRLAGAIETASNKALNLRRALASGVDKLPQAVGQIAGGYYGAKRIMAGPINAFSTLESATTDLKIAMMTKGAKVSDDFEAIKKIAVDQGNKLPGTTKDMTEAATELISLGITPEAVRNGGLVSSTNLGVVLNIDQKQAAMTVAKLREAFSLKDDELPKMADQVQRNRYAGGIKPDELLMATKYEAPVINALGMGGLQGMSEVLTVQGIANQKGMNGGEFGTNFAEMLTRLASGPLMMKEAKKGLKADASDRLDKLGIKFDFFDENGKIKRKDDSPVKGIIAELEKFNLIKNKDGTSDDRTKLEVAKAIFGSEGGRPALIMAQAGLAGYEAARQRVLQQADLDERINTKLMTFSSKLESLGGSLENAQASMATQPGNAAKPVMDGLNVIAGGLDDLFKNHPTLGTSTVLAGGAMGALVLGSVGGSIIKSMLLSGQNAVAQAVTTEVLAATPGGAAGAAAGAEAGAAGAAGAAGDGAAAVVPGLASKAALAAKTAAKWGGIGATIFGGIEAIGVLADDKADKPRDLTRIGVTTGGTVAGMAAGAALGSIVPGIGTGIGGIIGGILGSMGGSYGAGAAFDALWAPKPLPAAPIDWRGKGFVDPRLPGASGQSDPLVPIGGSARSGRLEVGDGKLDINIMLTQQPLGDWTATARQSVIQQPSIIKINAGATHPGGQ